MIIDCKNMTNGRDAMTEHLSIENIGYHRGADTKLYFSASLLLDGEQIAFYNSEFMELVVNEGAKDKINEVLDANFKKYSISGKSKKEKVHNLMEKLRELNG